MVKILHIGHGVGSVCVMEGALLSPEPPCCPVGTGTWVPVLLWQMGKAMGRRKESDSKAVLVCFGLTELPDLGETLFHDFVLEVLRKCCKSSNCQIQRIFVRMEKISLCASFFPSYV